MQKKYTTKERKKGLLLKKKYNNPFFRLKKEKNFLSIFLFRPSVLGAFFFVVVFSLFSFLVYSPIFKVRNIEINLETKSAGGQMIKNEIEKNIRRSIMTTFILWPKNNFFILSKDQIKYSLNKDFSFESISINKNFPDSLVVDLKEVEYAIIWLEDTKFYYSSQNGKIIREINPIDIKSEYPVIENNTQNRIGEDKLISPDNKPYLDFIIKMYKDLKVKDDFNFEKFIITPERQNSVTGNIFEGPKIYFSTETDLAEKQIKKLETLKLNIGEDFNKKEYIDLRFGDAVYYK